MSGTENCRFASVIGGRAMKVAIVPAILAVLMIASCPAAGEAMNLGTARFTGSGWTSYNATEVEFLFRRDYSLTYPDPYYSVSWYADVNNIGETLYVSAETSEYFETLASILTNGINSRMIFVQEEGAECDFFGKAPGVGGEHCDFCGWKINSLSLTIHSLEIEHGTFTYDVTVTVWGEILVTATTYYVDTRANGLNDGSSWANAYNFLQDALADANSSAKPVEIRVAQGVYVPDSNSAVPDGAGDREATFRLLNSVIIKGGHAGLGEPDPNATDVELYQTVLSGDLGGDDGLAFQNNGENSYSVVTGSSTDGRATLDGFIIIGGNANVNVGAVEGSPFSSGGGMFSSQGSPTVRNCAFEWNWVERSGGAMCNYVNSHPTVINCTFISNEAGASGGGMRSYDWSNPVVINSSFIQNSGETGAGGMSNHIDCNPTMNNCTFTGNVSGWGGGGMTVTNGNYGMGNNTFLANCMFTGNRSARGGGGINILRSHVTLINCVFTGNRAESSGSAIGGGEDDVTLVNCIVYGNTSETGYPAITGNPTVLYSNIQGGWLGEGNIDADPCFADPGQWALGRDPYDPADDFWVDGDYHLKSEAGRWIVVGGRWIVEEWIKDSVTSSCIDAGDPNSDWTAELWPHDGRINIGAYGGTSQASMSQSTFGNPADFNCDGTVDAEDLLMLAEMWSTEALLLKEDVTRDGLTNFPDFAEFADNWLWVISGKGK